MALSDRMTWLFHDKDKLIITSKERVEQLSESGFEFEACIIQSIVAEGMLELSIYLKGVFDKPTETEIINRNLDGLTLGGFIRRAKDHQLFNEDLIEKLNTFKLDRNTLIHNHLLRVEPFNYGKFLSQCEELIEILHHGVITEYAYNWLRKKGHPDAEKWKVK